MFLAIAVDNLADADSLTTIDKEEEGEGGDGGDNQINGNQQLGRTED